MEEVVSGFPVQRDWKVGLILNFNDLDIPNLQKVRIADSFRFVIHPIILSITSFRLSIRCF